MLVRQAIKANIISEDVEFRAGRIELFNLGMVIVPVEIAGIILLYKSGLGGSIPGRTGHYDG